MNKNIKDFSSKERPLRRKQKEENTLSDAKRKSFLFLVSAIGVGLLVGGGLFSLYKLMAVSEFFQLTDIRVQGSNRLDKQQIMALAGINYQSNILAINTGQIKKKIESHHWIQSAQIKRSIPSELRIYVKERVPVSLVNSGSGLYFLDKSGDVFAPANPPDDIDFPVITGLEKEVDARLSGEGKGLDERKNQLRKALTLIRFSGRGSSSLPRQNISEINLLKNGELIMFLADNPFPIYLGQEVSQRKYYRLAKVLYWLYKKREFSDVNFIRMDYMNNKILVGKNNDV